MALVYDLLVTFGRGALIRRAPRVEPCMYLVTRQVEAGFAVVLP